MRHHFRVWGVRRFWTFDRLAGLCGGVAGFFVGWLVGWVCRRLRERRALRLLAAAGLFQVEASWHGGGWQVRVIGSRSFRIN